MHIIFRSSLPPCGRCRPSCGLRRFCAALVALLRASPPLCSLRGLRAAVAAPRAAFGAFVRSSPPSCGPSTSPPHTGLGPVYFAGAASRGRPPKMSAAPSVLYSTYIRLLLQASLGGWGQSPAPRRCGSVQVKNDN